MSGIVGANFTCDGCGKAFVWKPQLAGKRAKCKCGAIISVPAQVAPAVAAARPPAPKKVEPDVDDDMYDLAPSRTRGHSASESALPQDEDAPPPLDPLPAMAAVAPARAGGTAGGASSPPHGVTRAAGSAVLGYRSRPTAAQKDRFSSDNLIDPARDLYAPIGIFLVGFLLYVGYYAIHYELGGTGVAMTTLGLGLITAFKTVLLVVFAMMAAGPLEISFGGVWTATLKLAAMAAFSDGVTTWVEAALEAGGAGGMSSLISFPVALGVYWVLLIYLFNMDAGDSWLAVLVLAVFDSIVRWLLLLLLLNSILGWGGVAGALSGGGGGAGDGSAASEARMHVRDLKDGGYLFEARQYAAEGKSVLMMDQVNAWYAAGAKTVWFEKGARDINGKSSIEGIIVELPTDPAKRAACYKVLDDYERSRRGPDATAADDEDDEPTEDDGEPYLMYELPYVR